MIFDIFIKSLTDQSTLKRDLLKTITWRIIGSFDSLIICFFITGNFKLGLQIMAAEIATKTILYFIHEKIWHHIKTGIPSREFIADRTKSNLQHQLFAQPTKITKQKREAINQHKAFTVWITGLSASGKSTIATALEESFFNSNIQSFVIDGDNTRLGINSDLSFSKEDRHENIRRVAQICKLFNESGTIAIAAFIAPFESDRNIAKEIIGDENFFLIYLNTNKATCKLRDRKGLYKLAEEGKIKDFTGVNSPYEIPENPDLIIDTATISVEASIENILKEIKSKALLN